MESEDEDRKFFRAAAEAIVATSMNNPIDPTILELLRRIQYASLSKNNNTEFLHQQLTQQQQQQEQQQQQNLGLIDSTKAPNFPTFNLNYFGLGNDDNNREGRSMSSNNQDIWKQNTSNTRSLKTEEVGPKTSSIPTDSRSIRTPASHSDTSSTNTPNVNPFTGNGGEPSSPGDGESKPFICRDCTLSFRRSSDLRRHQRAHLPVLPHVCQRCGKGFARKDALKRHTDTLTCKRNRERMFSNGGDLDGILARANEIKRQRLGEEDEDDYD